jgi:hypothetical protein
MMTLTRGRDSHGQRTLAQIAIEVCRRPATYPLRRRPHGLGLDTSGPITTCKAPAPLPPPLSTASPTPPPHHATLPTTHTGLTRG